MNLSRKPIESRQNSSFKKWRDCLKASGIREHGECLIMGDKIVRDLLSQRGDQARALLIPHRFPESQLSELLAQRWSNSDSSGKARPKSHGLMNPFSETGAALHRAHKSFHVYELTDSLFEVIDETGTHAPILVMEPNPIPEITVDMGITGLQVVLQLQDPNNLGAAIRSAHAFGASQIILLEGTAHPWIPKSVRSSAGTTLTANLCQMKSSQAIFETSGSAGNVGLDMHGTSMMDFQWPKNTRLFLGEEGQGLSGTFRGQKISIPMDSSVESLNATVSLSIALYDRATKLRT
ncbi:MAG: RNA methyltransferase [Bdellovibrionales bacterium]|nr:RNA methyltransferase [Bdellovibrionales bacterium]